MHQRPVRLPSLRRKTRYCVAEVGAVKGSILVDLASQVALSQWAEGNKADSEFLESRQDFGLRLPPPKGVLALKCGNWLDGVGSPNRLHPCFRKAEMLNFALLNQVFHCSRNLFYRHSRVNTVLVEQIDNFSSEPLERSLSDLLDMPWPTVQPSLFAGLRIELEAELRCNHHLLSHGSEGFSQEFFVGEGTVHFSGVEECDPEFNRRSDHGDHLLHVGSRTVAKAHPHAAEPQL